MRLKTAFWNKMVWLVMICLYCHAIEIQGAVPIESEKEEVSSIKFDENILSKSPITGTNYFCGFEDSIENSQWEFYYKLGSRNRWYIDSADYNIGSHSLYISSDGGESVSYVNGEGWAMAVREFVLPPQSIFDVSFDWKCFGEFGADEMYVCWLTDSTEVLSSNSSALPSWVMSTAQQVNLSLSGGRSMTNSLAWKSGNFVLNGNGLPARLVFVWRNNDSIVRQPAGVIDNIQMVKRNCTRPLNLNITVTSSSSVMLTWNGATNCEVRYRDTFNDYDEPWTVLTNRTSPCVISNLKEGHYSFGVRNVCDTSENGQSMWYNDHNVVIVADGCLAFTDIDNVSIATATYGTYQNPYAQVGVVDYGQFSNSSRHTVVYENMYDVNTDYGLLMIPNGKLASVRLGNSEVGAQAESISYDYLVDSANPILLLQYAVVLQDPNHIATEQPFFQLELLDTHGNMIDSNCGFAQFVPGQNTEGWNIVSDADSLHVVLWKDWTQMGVNLLPYIGQRVKIRLTTKDCSRQAHYGYAYFTLECAPYEVSGLSCGTEPSGSVCAPSGFMYRWYSSSDMTNILSESRCFVPVINDTGSYMCDVISYVDTTCRFQLSAVLTPQWPVAAAQYIWKPDNCLNKVQFTDLSTVINDEGELMNRSIETYYWNFGNGQTSTEREPIVSYSADGGNYRVMLVVGLSDNMCTDTTYIDISVPHLSSYESVITDTICLGQSYIFNGNVYKQSGLFVDTFKTINGCDSIIALDLNVYTLYNHTDSVTICEGEQYVFRNRVLEETGFYSDTIPTITGCDSVVSVYLTVNPTISIEWDEVAEICEDDESFYLSFTSLNGLYPTHYSLRFDDMALKHGFNDVNYAELDRTIQIVLPENVRAGHYSVDIELIDTLYNCNQQYNGIRFVINFSSQVIKQLWNDVLGVKNINYNGGYDFVSYQWYCNGEIIRGATSANYYVSSGELAFDSYYQALLTTSDGLTLFTCPFIPIQFPESINIVSIVIVNMSFNIESRERGTYEILDINGRVVEMGTLSLGTNSITAPITSGIFLLKIVTENGRYKIHKLVVVDG